MKCNFYGDGTQLYAVQTDGEGKVQLLASDGLKHLSNGQFLYPGNVVDDNSYRFMSAKDIADMTLCEGEFVYLDKQVIFSNAWSGRLFVEHQLEAPVTIAAITGGVDTDLDEALWYLKEYPLDLVKWTVKNSHRKDIELLQSNFRGQTTAVILPPDELLISRHNANRFVLDGGNGRTGENSAGDIWLFLYWMGRYLGIITAPVGD